MKNQLFAIFLTLGLAACSTPQSYSNFKTDLDKSVSVHNETAAHGVTLTLITPSDDHKLNKSMSLNNSYVRHDKTFQDELVRYSYALETKGNNFTFTEKKCDYEPSMSILLTDEYIDPNTRCIENAKFDFPPYGHQTVINGKYKQTKQKQLITRTYKINAAKSEHYTGSNIWAKYSISDYKEMATVNSLATHFSRYNDKQIQVKTAYGWDSVRSALRQTISPITQQDRDQIREIDTALDGKTDFSMGGIYIKLSNNRGFIAATVGKDKFNNGLVIYFTPTYYLFTPDRINGDFTFDYASARNELKQFIKKFENKLAGV